MADILLPDLCVIGAGAGGLSVAAAAAAFGVPVVLVEQGKMGGECLNYGCVPSKSLLAAARRVGDLTSLAGFGVTTGAPVIEFGKVREHLRSVMAALAPNDSVERFTGLGVKVVTGAARFVDRETVKIGNGITIKAKHYVIATGASPINPLIPGLDTTDYLTNETIFDLSERPDHLLVIGGGPVGIEMAQAFRRLGAAVTVMEARRPLGFEEPECVDVVLAQLERDGITVHANAQVRKVAHEGTKVQVDIEGEAGKRVVEGSHVLVAVGKWPNIDELDLPTAGVKYNANGIIVNSRLRTSNKRIYAVGDVTGGPRYTHVANYHANVVIRNLLFRLRSKVDYAAIPHVIFTDPELAQVGLTEAEARKRRYKFRVLRWSYFDNDRAQAERSTRGHIKVITDRSGRVLGASIVGDHAGELITTWTLAIAQKLNIRHLAQVVVPYPTLAEIGKRAAMSYFTPGLTNTWVRRLVSFLRLG